MFVRSQRHIDVYIYMQNIYILYTIHIDVYVDIVYICIYTCYMCIVCIIYIDIMYDMFHDKMRTQGMWTGSHRVEQHHREGAQGGRSTPFLELNLSRF